MLPVSAEIRGITGVAAGDDVEVGLELDTEPRAVAVPRDFADALDRDVEARQSFDGLSYTRFGLPDDLALPPDGDRRAPVVPRGHRGHRDHGVLGKHRDDGVHVAALPRVHVCVYDLAQAPVAQRPQRRLLALLGQPLGHRPASPLQRSASAPATRSPTRTPACGTGCSPSTRCTSTRPAGGLPAIRARCGPRQPRAARGRIVALPGLAFADPAQARLAFPERYLAVRVVINGMEVDLHNAHLPRGSTRGPT